MTLEQNRRRKPEVQKQGPKQELECCTSLMLLAVVMQSVTQPTNAAPLKNVIKLDT